MTKFSVSIFPLSAQTRHKMGQPDYRQWFDSIGICDYESFYGKPKKSKHFDDFWGISQRK